MNESPSKTLDDEEEGESGDLLTPAPMLKRMVAFGMDFVLLILLLQLLAHFLPNYWDANTREEFKSLLHEATLLSEDERMNSEEMSRFLEKSQLSPATYEMLSAMMVWACLLPILYFFVGERFFGGQSLGKATFGLRSVRMDEPGSAPSPFRQFFRATCKGISGLVLITPFLLPGLLNFLFCFINPKRRCLHDLIGGTMTIQQSNQGKDAQ